MRLNLNGGFYLSKSIIANAQRCINLYPESNPPDSPVPMTTYLTPGLTLLATAPNNMPVRCTYRTSQGKLYVVAGNTVYAVSSSWVYTALGTITNLPTICYMADNGLVIVLVDGTANGWAIDMTTNSFGQISSDNFYGGTRVDYVDTFFLFNVPGTFQWYISLSEANYNLLITGANDGIVAGTTTGGTGYTDGAYVAIPLTGGSGTGATGSFSISGGIVGNITIVAPGINYQVGDTLSASGIGANNISSGTTAGGSGYTNGTYTAVSLTGGSGTGATGSFVIASGIVGPVTIVDKGTGYLVGDNLSASGIGTGTGFAFTVTVIAGIGFSFAVTTINTGAFDPLAIATKNGYPDPIVTLIVMHRELWLIGALTSEVWYDAGNADFPFAEFPGAFIEHGCIAPYSIAAQDLSVYWLSQDKQGQTIVIRGASYQATRISTHAIENEISQYTTISDAIGFIYQQEGHVFYKLTFPTANKTWVYDQTTELWHEEAWTDNDGNLNRHRANCCANVYGINICGDWQNGNLYQIDPKNFTDNGQPISRIRSFPHSQEDNKRIFHHMIVADMDVGDDPGTIDGSTPFNPPVVSLRWSDTKGRSYGNALLQSLGSGGQYLTNMQWRRLGMARDRVYELSWSTPAITALNGAWLEAEKAFT